LNEYIECQRCGTLYVVDEVDSDYCYFCRTELETSQIIYRKQNRMKNIHNYSAKYCAKEQTV
jgi:hypothetical protein